MLCSTQMTQTVLGFPGRFSQLNVTNAGRQTGKCPFWIETVKAAQETEIPCRHLKCDAGTHVWSAKSTSGIDVGMLSDPRLGVDDFDGNFGRRFCRVRLVYVAPLPRNFFIIPLARDAAPWALTTLSRPEREDSLTVTDCVASSTLQFNTTNNGCQER